MQNKIRKSNMSVSTCRIPS